jgi:hypothetical protein
MPKFQVKGPDGQFYEINGPEGATQQQAEEYFRNNYKPSYYEPSQQMPQPESQPAIGGLADNVAKNVGLMKEPKYPAVVRAAQRTYEDIGQGLSDIGTGGLDFLYSGGQAVANIAGNDVLRGTQSILGLPQTEKPVEDINQYLRQREQGIQAEEAQRPQTGLVNVNVPRMVGQIAPQIPFMPLKAVGLARGALEGGVQAAAFTPATGEGDYWTQKAKQFGLGGLFSGLSDVALTAGRAIRGTAKGPLTEAEKVIQAGKQANIPVRTTDVYPPQSWAGKKLEAASDIVPLVGTGGGLVKTQEAKQKAAEDFVRQYVPEAESNSAWLQDITTQVKDKHGKMIEKFGNLKNRVLQRPEYNTSAGQKISISTPNLISAIDNELAAIKPSLEAEQITLAEMKAKGKEPSSVGDFAKMEQELLKIKGLASNNKGLNALEKLRETFSKNFAKDPTAFDFENKLYPYLREDMGNFLKSKSPVDYKRWQVGNQELQTLGKEVKKTSLSSIMNKGDIVPESAKNILLSKNASEVEILAKYLDNKGKQSAKSVIVEDMMARSKLKGEESIDPDKFLESLSQRQNQIKTFFSKQEQDAIEGLKRALQATKRSGKYAKSTPLQMGVGTLGAAGFGSLLPGLTQSLMGVAGAVAVGGRIYQSKAMRNTLVALGRVKRNSTAEQRLIDKLISLQAGQATAREITGE